MRLFRTPSVRSSVYIKGFGLMLVQMKVRGIVYDPYSNTYIIILRDEANTEVLPIWVGKTEANAISLALESLVQAKGGSVTTTVRMGTLRLFIKASCWLGFVQKPWQG